jgi:hypothetical protein
MREMMYDANLVWDQMVLSLPLLQGFDKTKGFKMGWYIEQEDNLVK